MKRKIVLLGFLALFLIAATYFPSDDVIIFRGGVRAPTQDQGGQVYNVKAYTGITCNGVANDTSGLNTLVAALPTTGATLLIPPGSTCITSTGLVFDGYDNLTIEGHGATLQMKDTTLVAASNVPLIHLKDCNNVQIKGLTIDGNRNGQTGGVGGYSEFNPGIRVGASSKPSTNVHIQDCKIFQTAGDNITVEYASSGIWVKKCDLSDPNDGGGNGNARQGVAVVSGSDVSIIANHFSDTTTLAGNQAVNLEGSSPAVISNILIRGNRFEKGFARCLSISGTAWVNHVGFEDNDCERYVFIDGDSTNRPRELKVIGNRLRENVYVQNSDYVTIADNTIRAGSYDTTIPGEFDGIHLDDSTFANIVGNIINESSYCAAGSNTDMLCQVAGDCPGSSCAAAKALNEGVRILGTSKDIVVFGNIIHGDSTWLDNCVLIEKDADAPDRILVGSNQFRYCVDGVDFSTLTLAGNVILLPNELGANVTNAYTGTMSYLKQPQLPSLSGSGSRCVNASSTGVLGASASDCNFYVHAPASAPPGACSGLLGHIYTDTDLNLPCFCNGTNWLQMNNFSTVCS